MEREGPQEDNIENSASTSQDRPNPATHASFKGAVKKVERVMRFTKADLVYNKAELETKFLQAAAQGRNRDLRVLLSNGQVDVNCADKEGRTAVIYAACKGQGESVGIILSAKAAADVQDDYGCSALHYAAASLSEPCIRNLLQYNADPMLLDCFGRTPLSLAVQAAPRKSDREAAQCIALLVKATLARGKATEGTDAPRIMDAALVSYALGVGDYPATIGVLAELGAHVTLPDEHGRSPLYHAVVHHRPNSIRELLGRGCSWVAHEGRQLNALHVAAVQGSLPVVRTLTDAARKAGVLSDLLSGTDAVGFTPLHYACGQGHADLASVLCSVGAAVDAPDAVNGLTPLQVALLSGKALVAEALLKAGASVEARDGKGRSVLHAACGCDGNDEAIAALLSRLVEAGADVSMVDHEGLTCAHMAAMKGSVALLKALGGLGADLAATDHEGRMALHWAAFAGFIDAFAHLSQLVRDGQGEPALCLTKSGRSPLHLAAQGRPELLATMLEMGYEPHINTPDTLEGQTPLHLASECGDPDCVALLVDTAQCLVDVPDKEGRTALHVASAGGHVGCLRILLDKGASIKARSKNGYAPIHYAAEAGNAQTCLLLAREGHDLDVTVPKGERTALHLAASKGHTLCAVSMVRMGADALKLDAVGRTPTAVALQHGFKDTAKTLEDELRRVRNFDATMSPLPSRSIGLIPSRRSAGMPRMPTHRALASEAGDLVKDTLILFQLGGIGFTTLNLVRRIRKLATSTTGVTDSMDLDMEEEEDDLGILSLGSNTKWAVMGVLSALPLLGFTAWLFGATDAPDSKQASRPYLAFAALYASPLLYGVALTPFAFACAALCAVHVQVERIRETEPEAALPVLGPIVGTASVAVVGRPLATQGRELADLVSSLRYKIGVTSRMTIAELAMANEERKALEDLRASKEIAVLELQQWDAAFSHRQRELSKRMDREPLGKLRGAARSLGLTDYSKLSKADLVSVLQSELMQMSKSRQ